MGLFVFSFSLLFFVVSTCGMKLGVVPGRGTDDGYGAETGNIMGSVAVCYDTHADKRKYKSFLDFLSTN